MAGVFVIPDQPEIAQLISMWVDPARRRSGVGTSLVDAVVRWARGRGARRIQLWVTDTNHQAISLYARAGFARTERVQPLPSNPALQQVLMVQALTLESE
jgi:ribosomal protein S18 acetylase RimI-like enzyme